MAYWVQGSSAVALHHDEHTGDLDSLYGASQRFSGLRKPTTPYSISTAVFGTVKANCSSFSDTLDTPAADMI